MLRNRGFTLFELMIVLAIMGLLISIVVVSGNTLRQRTNDEKIITDVQKVVIAIENYRKYCRTYPSSLGLTTQNGPYSSTNCTNRFGDFLKDVNTNDTSWYQYQPLKGAGASGFSSECTGYQFAARVAPGGIAQTKSDANYATFSAGSWLDCGGGQTKDLKSLLGANIYHVWGPK